ncbi:MAG TPA: hypothetical protein VN397_03975 [Candidatus Methylomirabilis sp.]|nr:hypothetical protein [Candidatus Methylomirabilis sp.]
MTKNYLKIQITNEACKRVIVTGLLVSFMLVSVPMRTAAAVELIPPMTLVQAVQKADADAAVVFTVPGIKVPDEPTADEREQATGHKVVRVLTRVPTTAYTSRPEETDSTPFITADGSHVRDGIVAANFLKFGTRIRIPELYGDKIFEVHDRMNKRYHVKVDIWMDDLTRARKHGVRRVTIEVVEPVQS